MVYHNKNIIMPPVSIPTCKSPERLTLVLHQGRVRVRFVAHINVVIVSRTSPFPTVPTHVRCTWQSSEKERRHVMPIGTQRTIFLANAIAPKTPARLPKAAGTIYWSICSRIAGTCRYPLNSC